MQNTLDIELPQEATLAEQVQELIKNPPKICECPSCGNEFSHAVEREFIQEFGMCLGCDKLMCDLTVEIDL